MAGPVNKCPSGWCLIPGGEFKIGSSGGGGENCDTPQRDVTLAPYEIQRTEVPVGKYKKSLAPTHHNAEQQSKFVLLDCSGLGTQGSSVYGKVGESLDQLRQRAKQIVVLLECKDMVLEQEPFSSTEIEKVLNWPANQQGDDYPVVGLTFPEKEAYCQSLGKDVHVVSEAQFERAAKRVGGGQHIGHHLDIDTSDPSYVPLVPALVPVPGANDDGRCNSFGVCDLEGNAWESSSDIYNVSKQLVPKWLNPVTDVTKRGDTFHGDSWGSLDPWSSLERGARAAAHLDVYPGDRNDRDGFRCARPLPPDPKK